MTNEETICRMHPALIGHVEPRCPSWSRQIEYRKSKSLMGKTVIASEDSRVEHGVALSIYWTKSFYDMHAAFAPLS